MGAYGESVDWTEGKKTMKGKKKKLCRQTLHFKKKKIQSNMTGSASSRGLAGVWPLVWSTSAAAPAVRRTAARNASRSVDRVDSPTAEASLLDTVCLKCFSRHAHTHTQRTPDTRRVDRHTLQFFFSCFFNILCLLSRVLGC